MLMRNNLDIFSSDSACCVRARVGLASAEFHPRYAVTSLSSLLPRGLLTDFPVHEWVLVTTAGTLPRAFSRICVVRMNHFNDQVAMQAHCGLAVHVFLAHGF